MIYKYFMPVLIAAVFMGCDNDKKADKNTGGEKSSINKIWVFKKVDTAKSNLKTSSSLWIGDNTIDMTNPDTLHYSTIATNNGTTNYQYKVSGGYIYLDGKRTYRILSVTDSTMQLSAQYNVKEQDGAKNSYEVVMDYKAR